ncbi:unnamed protein product [Soboliphyme baturini]|uniref:Ig-like domain-containing protein n=1 Tax=Soboliphyme baturini TaxID=241478 RepID=A0A183ILC8_9BILA|nr:unnamed protein product [Soboliphyme baturini]
MDELVNEVPRLVQISKHVCSSLHSVDGILVKLIEKPYVRISQSPQNAMVTEGDRLHLHCEANGIPPPRIYWMKNGEVVRQDISQDEHNTVDMMMNVNRKAVQNGNTAGELVVDCASVQDLGQYQCFATNGLEVVSSKATVLVRSADEEQPVKKCKVSKPPQIFMWSDFRFEMNGNAVQLFCRTTGFSKSQVLWLDPEGNEIRTNDQYEVLANGDLIIKHGKWEYGGLYTCKVENRFGSDQKQVFYYPTAV